MSKEAIVCENDLDGEVREGRAQGGKPCE